LPQVIAAIDGYDVLGYRAAVGATGFEAQAAVRSILRGFGPVDVGPGLHLPRYEITTEGKGWQLRVDGSVVQEDADFLSALGALEWYVVAAALSHRNDLFQLHSAALCLPTQRAGIVLVGDSGSGKTTLALALMLRGFVPFSDDVALIDPETLELQPLRRAFHVSDDTRRLVKPLTFGLLGSDDDPHGYFSPVQWAGQSAPERWLLFVEHHPEREPQLVPLAAPEAATAILAQALNLSKAPRLALAVAARLVERCSICRFLTSDIEASVAVLQQHVTTSAGMSVQRARR
jgi:hypothetical protein